MTSCNNSETGRFVFNIQPWKRINEAESMLFGVFTQTISEGREDFSQILSQVMLRRINYWQYWSHPHIFGRPCSLGEIVLKEVWSVKVCWSIIPSFLSQLTGSLIFFSKTLALSYCLSTTMKLCMSSIMLSIFTM